MWNGKKVSVIFPTYNEKDSIRAEIEAVLATGLVDEVLVVNNNAAQGTSEEVAKTPAREVTEATQGYGQAIRRGLKEATGDYLIVSEPDGTFAGHDVVKLLAYAPDFDYVIGTRTTRTMIWKGANMGLFLKWGNWAVAKMAEFLFNGSMLTDCGCTLRLIARPLYDELRPYFTRTQNDFGFELTLLVVSHKGRFMEIPVNYRGRVGVSAVTGSFWKAFRLGLRMIGMVCEFRLGFRGKKKAADEGYW
jgi:glycosyltransferase involved in cell wall biosynthesis